MHKILYSEPFWLSVLCHLSCEYIDYFGYLLVPARCSLFHSLSVHTNFICTQILLHLQIFSQKSKLQLQQITKNSNPLKLIFYIYKIFSGALSSDRMSTCQRHRGIMTNWGSGKKRRTYRMQWRIQDLGVEGQWLVHQGTRVERGIGRWGSCTLTKH